MFNDKKSLLKSAAHVALDKPDEGWEWIERECSYRRRYGGDWQTWNPLEDDGDALRLAVKLRLDILFSIYVVEVSANTGVAIDMEPLWSESYGDDPYAATRNAIVKIAAELGKR